MRIVSLQKLRRTLSAAGFITLAATAVAFAPNPAAHAAVTPNTATGQVSFTFDDGFQTFITKAAPTLAQYGLKGTGYIIPGCVGMTTAPNTCEASGAGIYMTWDQVTQLQNQYNWEIGSHSQTHQLMTTLTAAQLEQEVSQSKANLQAHGFNPTAFATPFGDYNPAVQAAIAKYYTSHRPFHDLGFNTYPYNPYLLQVQQVQGGTSVATVKGWIDQAKANNTWLILVFHDVRDDASSVKEDYQYKTSDLAQIAAYVQAQNVKNVNVSEAILKGTDNQLPATTVNSTNGWTTDTPNSVANDTGNHGDTPSPTDSIKMTSSTTDVHIFAPAVTVDATKEYWISGYANITALTSGEVALYIDEYDINGNWISGKYAQALNSAEMKDISYIYKATSANVAKAAAQIIVTANSGITAYIDNVKWFPVAAGSTPTPTDPTTPPTTPTTTNVMTNSQFDSGITGGWTTDNATAIVADTANHGSTTGSQNSVKFTAPATGNAHLFAPKVAVTSGTQYTVKAFLNLLTLTTGEVAFYVDEYDANGTWISGQYIYAKRAAGSEEVSFIYTPSSANVKNASLQFIVQGNSGISGYLDNVQWLAPGTTTTTPPTTPTDPTTPPTTPTPTPTTTVLETSFATGLGTWTTDAATEITADANGMGASDEAQHSVKMTANATKNVHLFSPQTPVVSGGNYTLQAYLNIAAVTSGEVAFYVDEYDANGTWVSGKYLHAETTAGVKNVSLSYTPTSATVAKASLQVIVTSNSGITAYIDSIKWVKA